MEEWRDVVGYEGLYKVSNLGRVQNIRLPICSDKRTKLKDIYLVKPSLQKMGGGYSRYRLNLWKNNKGKMFKVHRLVAQAFIPNPENKPQVNHIDNNPLNNNITNLEWCTNKENAYHAIRQGRLDNKGEKNGMSRLSPTKVLEIYTSKKTAKELMAQYNVSYTSINTIKRKVAWKHVLKEMY